MSLLVLPLAGHVACLRCADTNGKTMHDELCCFAAAAAAAAGAFRCLLFLLVLLLVAHVACWRWGW
jgi:hypothetical protein